MQLCKVNKNTSSSILNYSFFKALYLFYVDSMGNRKYKV